MNAPLTELCRLGSENIYCSLNVRIGQSHGRNQEKAKAIHVPKEVSSTTNQQT